MHPSSHCWSERGKKKKKRMRAGRNSRSLLLLGQLWMLVPPIPPPKLLRGPEGCVPAAGGAVGLRFLSRPPGRDGAGGFQHAARLGNPGADGGRIPRPPDARLLAGERDPAQQQHPQPRGLAGGHGKDRSRCGAGAAHGTRGATTVPLAFQRRAYVSASLVLGSIYCLSCLVLVFGVREQPGKSVRAQLGGKGGVAGVLWVQPAEKQNPARSWHLCGHLRAEMSNSSSSPS